MFSDLPNRLAPITVRLAALGIGFVVIFSLVVNLSDQRQMDFIAFWAAGKLVLAGDVLSAYDVEAHKQVQMTVKNFKGLMPFAYPPPFLFVVTPFGLLPYATSALVWAGLGYLIYLLAAQRLGPGAGWTAAAFPPVLIDGIIGQNGMLTGSIFILGTSLLKRHPLWAGLVLGCLVIKPHLAVLLPLALAAGGYWRAFAGAAISSTGLALLALLVFGVEAYAAFLEQMPLFSSIVAKGLVGWHKMASVFAALRLVGAGEVFAWSAHILIAVAAAVMVGIVWRSDADLDAKAAMLGAASALISPYLYQHDTMLLIVPFVWLARDGEDKRVLAALWCIALVFALQNWGFNEVFNPAPLLPLGMIVLIWRRLRTDRPGIVPAAPLLAT
jgi:hypothetical protein